jgi:dihydropteroate synthase
MFDLPGLAEIFKKYGDDFSAPIAKFDIGGKSFDFDADPVLMGVVNLSQDSWYRSSVAGNTAEAIALGARIAGEGAHVIDIGAEATMAETALREAELQIAGLVPMVEGLREANVLVSVETYWPEVARACLAAGANVLNLTGRAYEGEIFDLAAEHEAAVVMCFVQSETVREVRDFAGGVDLMDEMIEHFHTRVALAKAAGVSRIFIDPVVSSPRGGLERLRHQALTLLTSFRLRRLGWPVCNALLAGADYFVHDIRDMQAFFAVLARLGRNNMYRTHEVAKVRAVLSTMQALG